jgi:uncharacterized protein YjbI with pentapeptide repeats
VSAPGLPAEALEELRDSGRLSLRDVPVEGQDLAALLRAAEVSELVMQNLVVTGAFRPSDCRLGRVTLARCSFTGTVNFEGGYAHTVEILGCEFQDMLTFGDLDLEELEIRDTSIAGPLRARRLRSRGTVHVGNGELAAWLDVVGCQIGKCRLDTTRIAGRLEVSGTGLEELALFDSSVMRSVRLDSTQADQVTFIQCDLPGGLDASGLRAPGISVEGSTLGDVLEFGNQMVLNCRGTSFLRTVAMTGQVLAGSRFDGAVFDEGAEFDDCIFEGSAEFSEATFKGPFRIRDTTVKQAAAFDGAVFERPSEFAGLETALRLSLDRSWFHERVALSVRASRLSMVGTRFASGATIRADSNSIDLADAEFGGPSLLGVPRVAEAATRVVSLRGADVEGLTVSGVDLSSCRFHRAHNLDKLRLEADARLAWTPHWSVREVMLRKVWPWTRRQVVAEESELRAAGSSARAARWYAPPPLEDGRGPLSPTQLVEVYRGLRKGREDNKDEPGAADFYYGEMEMRRLAGKRGSGSRAEYAVLTLYWLISGYALRASRALIALAVVVLCGAVLLDWFGFRPDRDFGRALLYSLESTVSLLRAPTAKLTAGGEVVQIVLRLLGPLLFGLALLSLRGRVKR